jgi:peptidoglycan/xylan/chitin deacetylase (PgdA/CDA1 family)
MLITRAKNLVFRAGESAGLFQVARRKTARGLRILCYHGVSLNDESGFRPKLFMDPGMFRSRLEFLAENQFPVLSIEQGLNLLEKGSLPPCATVITIDDGFYSVYRIAFPLLRKFRFPATLYVTSYYSLKQNPVFRLVVQYMFWKTTRSELDLRGMNIAIPEKIHLSDASTERGMWRLIEYGENNCDETERCDLCCILGDRLGVDYEVIVKRRGLSLANASELREMSAAGLDIQLHTHRHRFPEAELLAVKELKDNKHYLNQIVDRPLRHFCCPSGTSTRAHWDWLRAEGICSAVTCAPGFAYQHTSPMGLPRFLDGSHVSDAEFKAEMFGYTELLRRVRSRLGWARLTLF